MSQSNVVELSDRVRGTDPLTELIRSGARQLIQQAVEAELQTLLARYADHKCEDGKAAVVRNGHLPEREIQTGIGPVKVRTPKVRSRTGEPVTLSYN